MPELVLHQYPASPFSEKIRLVLGYKKLAWKSVHVPSVLPKPDALVLTGGYRKCPFLQIGADIYCDTALICDVLEHLQPEPALYPPHLKGVSRVFAHWADTTLFWAAMAYNLNPRGLGALFANAPPQVVQAFAADRAQMTAGTPRLRPGDAAVAYRSYLRRIANMAEEHEYLFGLQPCIADFSAYHPLWFSRVCNSAMAGIFEPTPAVLEWMDRVAAIGHGDFESLSAQDAIALAAAHDPVPLCDEPFMDEHDIALGTQVTVAADDYGTEPTQGELLAATRMHYTLGRTDRRTGRVHVHFPRIGYVLRAVKK